jgi:hypothetical protein
MNAETILDEIDIDAAMIDRPIHQVPLVDRWINHGSPEAQRLGFIHPSVRPAFPSSAKSEKDKNESF